MRTLITGIGQVVSGDLAAPLLDAEYGSASYVAVTRPADLEVRVSTSGLLIREQAK